MILSCNVTLLCQKNWLNSKHYFIMKIPNKQELQQIAFLKKDVYNAKIKEIEDKVPDISKLAN